MEVEMLRRGDAEVIVVGAGPVGMVTALVLAQSGIDVRIVDKDRGDTTRSYACVLHARTLRLFEELGLADEVVPAGRTARNVACFRGAAHWAELNLDAAGGPVSLLPQCELEELLEQRLGALGVKVEWGNRLTDLEQSGDEILATLAELTSTGKGYAVPHVDEIVRRTTQIGAKFLVGADGRDSHVRELLGIRQKQYSPGTCYHMFEIAAQRDFPGEIRMAFDDAALNLFTPLTERRCRFVFQVPYEDVPYEAYLKDRTHFRIVDARGAAMTLFEDFCARYAPWFDAGVEYIEWHGTIPFDASLSTALGRHHCCLAGDAAHLNSPLGMQSMNLGICEGIALSRSLASILRGGADPNLLREYDEVTRAEWEALLNADVKISADYMRRGGPPPKALVSALPATGEDLSALLRQVGIGFEPHPNRRHSDAVH